MANPKSDVKEPDMGEFDVRVNVVDRDGVVVYGEVVRVTSLLERYKKILLVQEVLNRKSRSSAQRKLEV